MASYNEITHTQSSDVNSMDPLYRWDTHFPERLSKLHLNQDNTSPTARRQRQRRNRNAARFKTQPITFDEIKEVDEESKESKDKDPTSPEVHDNIKGIKSEFAAFSRSMDGILPGSFPRREKTREPSTDSNKENNPSDLADHAKGTTEVPSASNVLSSKSPAATKSNVSTPSASNTSTPAAITSQTIDPVSGLKIPAGLPADRDAGRARRKQRKKNKGIAEEAPDGDKNGATGPQNVG